MCGCWQVSACSSVRCGGHSYPREWFHALMFPFPPMPTCLFTRRDDTRPEIHALKTLALAEHARAVEDGRL